MKFKCNATTYVFTKKLVFYRDLTEQTVQQYNSFASVNVLYGTFLPVSLPEVAKDKNAEKQIAP